MTDFPMPASCYRTHADVVNEWRLRYPVRRAAHLAARAAIKNGTLTREPCAQCGSSPSDAHHRDYAKPMDVTWLCRKHHLDWHVQNGPGLNGGEPSLRSLRITRARIFKLAANGWLYDETDLILLENRIRDDVAAELGFRPQQDFDLTGLICSDSDFGMCAADATASQDNDALTLQQIGDIEGVTRERIRQLEERSLGKMRVAADALMRIGKPIERLAPSPNQGRARIKKQRRCCKCCGHAGHDRRNRPQRKAAA